MLVTDSDRLFAKGLAALKGDDTLSALVHFEKAYQLETRPQFLSYLAFCLAKERGQYKKAISLCREALENDADNQAHYLNLGRIHMLMGNKPDAILAFREGLAFGKNSDISGQLEELGARRKPVFPFLGRGNPINKFVGIILSRLGLR